MLVAVQTTYTRLEALGALMMPAFAALLATSFVWVSARFVGVWQPPVFPMFVVLGVLCFFGMAPSIAEGSAPVGYEEVRSKYESTVRRKLRARRLPMSVRCAVRGLAFLIVKSAMTGWVTTLLFGWLLGRRLEPHMVPVYWGALSGLEFAMNLLGWLWRARFPTFDMTLQQRRDYMVKEIRRFEPFWYPSYWDQPVS